MNETEVIETFRSKLDAALSVPIRTSAQEDDRKVPVVIIEDWTHNEMNFHNSPFAGDSLVDTDNDGKLEYEKYLRFDFKERLEFTVRHHDEVKASQLKDKLVNHFRLYTDDISRFHKDAKSFSILNSGNPTYEFVEPKETEEMVAVRLHADHTMTLGPDDLEGEQIDAIQNDFTFNPN